MVKAGIRQREQGIFMSFCLILLTVLFVGSFQLWTIQASREEVKFVEAPESASMTASALPDMFVASRKGKNYYYPWCSGASRLKESNKIWFKSAKEAEAAGYKLASGCQ